MGEIVRVLKWRLDVDAEGMASGIDKAATSAERLSKAAVEVGTKAAPGLKATASAAKEADTAFEGLNYEAQQVLRYVQSLEKGAGSPLVLKRNAEQAEAAFNVLAQSAQKAGQAIPEAFSDRVITAIQKGTTQAERMNAELEKMGGQTPTKLDKVITALDKTAQSSAKAATALKSTSESTATLGKAVEGSAKSTERLGDTVRKSTEGVTKFKGAALEAWGALSLGTTIGNALANAINKIDASMAAADKKANDVAVSTIKFQQAMKLAEKGYIALGGSQEQFLARYDAYVQKTSPATRATEAQTKALERQKKAWDDLGAAMDAAGKGAAFTFQSPEEAFGDAGKYAERLNDILKKAFADGGAKERLEWAKANEDVVERVVAAYAKWGKDVPAHVKAAYEEMKKDSVDWVKVLQEENAAAEVVYQAKLDRWAAEDAAANRTSRAADEYKQIQDAAFGAAVANGELGTNLDRVAEAVVATGGQMVVGAPVWIQIAEATRQAKDELLGYLEATKLFREDQTKTLDAASGWMDYLVGLKNAYNNGTIELTTYIGLLGQFRTQVLQLFGGATGEAKKAVDDLTAAVQALISTAGARGPVDNSYKGVFERSFNGRK